MPTTFCHKCGNNIPTHKFKIHANSCGAPKPITFNKFVEDSKKYWQEHVRNPEEPYKCPEKDCKFARKNGVYKHWLTVHHKIPCSECGKKLSP